MELEIIPEKKIRVSRDQVEEKFSLGNLQLQFGRKLEYLGLLLLNDTNKENRRI